MYVRDVASLPTHNNNLRCRLHRSRRLLGTSCGAGWQNWHRPRCYCQWYEESVRPLAFSSVTIFGRNACIANHANEIMFHAGTSELQRFISCALSRSASAPHARRSSFPFPRVVQLTPSDGSCLTAQANSYLSAITTKVRYFMCWVNVLLHR